MSGPQDVGFNPIIVGFMLFICAVAVIFNILVIIVTAKVGKFRTSIEVFLTNTSLADILLAGVALPLYFKQALEYDEDFQGGNAFCKFIMFIPHFIVISATATKVMLAADRYRMVIQSKTIQVKKAVIIVGLIWAYSFCLASPHFYEYNVYSTSNETTNQTQIHVRVACGSEGIVANFEAIYAGIVFLMSYCIPVVLFVAFYARIWYFIWKHNRAFQKAWSRQPETARGSLPDRMSAKHVKVLKMLMSVTGAFIVLWMPYFILFVIKEMTDMDHTNDFGKLPHIISRLLIVLSTTVNPAIYAYFSDSFRAAVYDFCKPRQPRQSPRNATMAPGNEFSVGLRQARKIRPTEENLNTCNTAHTSAV